MSLPVLVLFAYTLLQVGVGLYVARRVRGAGDFFVAGRRPRPRAAAGVARRRQHRRGLDRWRHGPRLSRGSRCLVVGGLRRAGDTRAGLPGRSADPPDRGRARPAHGRRFPGASLRPDAARDRGLAAVDRHARDPDRPARGRGQDPARGDGPAAGGGSGDRRPGDDRVLHRGGPAGLGLGQRVAARGRDRDVPRPAARRTRRCRRMAGRGRARTRRSRLLGLLGRRLGPAVPDPPRSGLLPLARPAAEGLRSAQRPHGSRRRRPERAFPRRLCLHPDAPGHRGARPAPGARRSGAGSADAASPRPPARRWAPWGWPRRLPPT